MNLACVTCLEQITLKCDISSTPCGHLFHTKCIKEWLNKDKWANNAKKAQKTCPQCRSNCNYLTKMYFTEYEDIESEINIPKLLTEEFSILKDKNKNLEKTNKKLGKKVTNLDGKAKEFEKTIAILEGKNEKVEAELQKLEGTNQKLEETVVNLDGKNKELESMKNEDGQKTNELQEKSKMLKRENTKLKKNRTKLQKKVEELDEEKEGYANAMVKCAMIIGMDYERDIKEQAEKDELLKKVKKLEDKLELLQKALDVAIKVLEAEYQSDSDSDSE